MAHTELTRVETAEPTEVWEGRCGPDERQVAGRRRRSDSGGLIGRAVAVDTGSGRRRGEVICDGQRGRLWPVCPFEEEER